MDEAQATRDASDGTPRREGLSRRSLWVRGVALSVFALGSIVVLVVWGDELRAFFENPAHVRTWIRGFGALAPVVSVALSALQVIVAPIPGQFVGLVNGFLFGVVPGFGLSLLGLVFGSAIAMYLSRVLGRPFVERLFDPGLLTKWDRLTRDRGALFFFLVYLVPGLPDDLACFVIGISGLSIPRMLLLATLGRAPGTFAACWAGAHADELSMPIVVAISVAMVAFAIAFAKYADRFEALVLRVIGRVDSRDRP